MIEWIDDHFPAVMIAVVVVVIGSVVGIIIAGARWDNTHVCVSATQPYEHAPTYVMVGKIMTPVGGGYYSDCLEWKARE